MLLTIDIDDIKINNILFNKSTNNTIIDNSEFIKIIFSNDLFSLNSIIININFNFINIINKYDKVYYNFDIAKNISIISKLIDIEHKILKLLNNNTLQPMYNLKNYFLFKNNFIINNSYNKNHKNFNDIKLKISGIWKTKYNYGLIYKFI
jgi:hypothetical protein